MHVRALAAAALAALALAACGGERSDVSAGVDALNRELAREGVRLSCPAEVDGGAGAEFRCELKGTASGRTTRVALRIVEEGDALAVDFAAGSDQVQSAIRRVTAG